MAHTWATGLQATETPHVAASSQVRSISALHLHYLIMCNLICMSDLLTVRDVNFREFYFSIREFQISRLVEYSKVTWQLAWTTHLMRECCNSVDITPRGCGWAAAPGKWSDEWEAVTVSNYKARIYLTNGCHPKLITRCGCNCPTMNSPSRALTLTGWGLCTV